MFLLLQLPAFSQAAAHACYDTHLVAVAMHCRERPALRNYAHSSSGKSSSSWVSVSSSSSSIVIGDKISSILLLLSPLTMLLLLLLTLHDAAQHRHAQLAMHTA
jgi:hypothetical protein